MNLNNMIHYCEDFNLPDPLSGISVPDPINKNLVRSAIVTRCGLLTPLYGEPEVFTSIVTDWFKEKQWTFEHLINIIKAEYSPIENVDEYTDYLDARTRKDTGGTTEERTRTGKDTSEDSYTDIKTNDGGYTDTVTNTISAENSSTYQPDSQRTTVNEHDDADRIDHTGSGIKEAKETEKVTRSNTGSGNDDLKHTGRRHGNIGVTSNQNLILQETDLLRHFDIYRYIAELFETDHMLMIY